MTQKDFVIAVLDGQGGGIGKNMVRGLKKEIPSVPVWVFGTNHLAAYHMEQAGAEEVYTGEESILKMLPKAKIILGVTAILTANALKGEITPAIAAAVSRSTAFKILVPVNRCSLYIAIPNPPTLQQCIAEAVLTAKKIVQKAGESYGNC